MSNIVLLVVDVQTGLIEEHPYNEQQVIDNIRTLIEIARENKQEVIFVRHNDGIGGELEFGTDSWQIYKEITPETNEKIFDKQYNSAFLKTGLKEYLDNNKIGNIILVGLQTEYCIDTTCKCAFEYGFKVIIPEGTNTTFDNDYLSGKNLYEFYNYKIWKDRFASLLPVEDAIKILSRTQAGNELP